MNTNKRLTNWDLLRALSMFLVVVVHIAPQLGSFHGINAGAIVGTGALFVTRFSSACRAISH